ncbi:hypothetical protein BC832DRAFT_566531 [Gaertneriomyces semiglobifer]|nr:hypothetical protein BC832DRAFT_566531 [Gaertneriomyces semiglobifer]
MSAGGGSNPLPPPNVAVNGSGDPWPSTSGQLQQGQVGEINQLPPPPPSSSAVLNVQGGQSQNLGPQGAGLQFGYGVSSGPLPPPPSIVLQDPVLPVPIPVATPIRPQPASQQQQQSQHPPEVQQQPVPPVLADIIAPSSSSDQQRGIGQQQQHQQLPPELTPAESTALGASQQYRPLNVKDALSYLDQVKIKFSDQPEVYNRFLDIMKDFKSQALDTPGVIERVSTLFRGNNSLISGFNTFLPPGYRIEPGPNDTVKVTTPRTDNPMYHVNTNPGLHSLGEGASSLSGNPVNPPHAMPPFLGPSPGYAQFPLPSLGPQHPPGQPYNAALASANIISSMGGAPILPAVPGGRGPGVGVGVGIGPGAERRNGPGAPVEFNHAINYVNKIKNRFSGEPDTYKMFLEILQTYQKEQKPIGEVYEQVRVLFRSAPDLLDEFQQFLPENELKGLAGVSAKTGTSVPLLGTTADGMAVPQMGSLRGPSGVATNAAGGKKTKRPASGGNSAATGQLPPPQKKKKMRGSNAAATVAAAATIPSTGGTANMEELEFFERAKKVINNRTTYNEFMKILNLFSQEIIDNRTLIQKVSPFLHKSPELLEWFKRFVRYNDEELDIICNIPAEVPDYDPNSLRKVGHSYRHLPPGWSQPVCSGRDAIAKEVLNDEWKSFPFYESETGFVSHRKTPYEETLHKCEEERYEFDIHIEANLHTIALLEPIAKRIMSMTADERARFRLPVGLGGTSKTIYQRIIKKVYDRERGLEIIDALHNNPAVAVPVVLKRLKQKDEEWKRAQRDWNKVWREIDSKNFYKALDHQGISFKSSDKKTMSAKCLIGEIEAVYREQREKMALQGKRGQELYQFDFSYKDVEIFTHVRKLLRFQMEMHSSLSDAEQRRVKELIRTFVTRFFCLPGHERIVGGMTALEDEEGEKNGSDEEDEGEEGEGIETDGDESGRERDAKGPRPRGNSLRRSVLMRAGLNGEGATSDEEGEGENGSESGWGGNSAAGSGAMNRDGMNAGDESDTMDMDFSSKVSDEEDTQSAANHTGGSTTNATSTAAAGATAPRATYVFYANNAFYVFLRLHQMLYSRLLKMKELSEKLAQHPPESRKSRIALELGLQKLPKPSVSGQEGSTTLQHPQLQQQQQQHQQPQQPRDRYSELLKLVFALLQNEIDSSEYEERARSMFGTSAYLVFTVDKLCQAIAKAMQAIVMDSKSMKLLDLYFKDRGVKDSGARSEALYRIGAEQVLGDEMGYRMEWFVQEKVLTLQVLGKEDGGSPSATNGGTGEDEYGYTGPDRHSGLSHDDKWSLYVDTFIQLHTPMHQRSSFPRLPYLRRTLPTNLKPEDYDVKPKFPVLSRSGLEMKICVNTYKVFFVDHTEDWYWRCQRGEGRAETRRERSERWRSVEKQLKEAGWERPSRNEVRKPDDEDDEDADDDNDEEDEEDDVDARVFDRVVSGLEVVKDKDGCKSYTFSGRGSGSQNVKPTEDVTTSSGLGHVGSSTTTHLTDSGGDAATTKVTPVSVPDPISAPIDHPTPMDQDPSTSTTDHTMAVPPPPLPPPPPTLTPNEPSTSTTTAAAAVDTTPRHPLDTTTQDAMEMMEGVEPKDQDVQGSQT